MYKIIFSLSILFSLSLSAQTSTEKQKILYGACTRDSLTIDPFGKWFNTGYDSYQPNTQTLGQLKKQNFENISIQVFFGTWCGDSKREVPRFLKLMKELSFPEKKISLIAVGGGDSLVKQSPQHEEAGKGIFRVPTFIIYKDGKEINRITEFPVYSLEKDMLAILDGQSYTPNYHSFSPVNRWLGNGTLTDDNVSATGLAEQLRWLVHSENELNSLAYLLLKQEKKKEALTVFRINYILHPESSNLASSLGEGYYENGDYPKAISWLEKSLELIKTPAEVKPVLSILYKAKDKEKK